MSADALGVCWAQTTVGSPPNNRVAAISEATPTRVQFDITHLLPIRPAADQQAGQKTDGLFLSPDDTANGRRRAHGKRVRGRIASAEAYELACVAVCGSRSTGVERDSGKLVSAAEILHVTRHPGFGFLHVLRAQRLDDAALRDDDARSRLAHSIHHATQRRREQPGHGLHGEDQDAIAAESREPAEKFHDAVDGGVARASRIDHIGDRCHALRIRGRGVACRQRRDARRDGEHRFPELGHGDVIEHERATYARGGLGCVRGA